MGNGAVYRGGMASAPWVKCHAYKLDDGAIYCVSALGRKFGEPFCVSEKQRKSEYSDQTFCRESFTVCGVRRKLVSGVVLWALRAFWRACFFR